MLSGSESCSANSVVSKSALHRLGDSTVMRLGNALGDARRQHGDEKNGSDDSLKLTSSTLVPLHPSPSTFPSSPSTWLPQMHPVLLVRKNPIYRLMNSLRAMLLPLKTAQV